MPNVEITTTEIMGLGLFVVAMIFFPALIVLLAGLPIWILVAAFAIIYWMFFRKRPVLVRRRKK